jgi:hypothetical protein
MTNHQEEIIDELKKMTRLLSIIATHGLSQRDQIAVLEASLIAGSGKPSSKPQP